ncbi:MAG TPA: DUF4438 domain-containing protein [Pseudonocardiaceae bacterium]|jgi:hypothetical protein|nr:DUF4438 domain-containing protein [Pseudonocardiaceae bacterium]
MTATVVATNLGGVVETPELGGHPTRVDVDGRPYVPIGDGGVVLGVRLGDGVFATDADHAAPGACLVHPDQSARHALTSYSCLGNPVTVRNGAAAGARGVVLGKRGELGRVIACFPADVLARLAPTDAVVVRGYGQGAEVAAGVHLRNVSPGALELLPVQVTGDRVSVSVRAVVGSHVVGNGIGRPVEQWDLDLQVDLDTAPALGLADLVLGDLVAVSDLDVRHNAGYRTGYVTVGVIVHGASPQPGHGPGLMPILCGPADAIDVRTDPAHVGVTEAALLAQHDR